MKKVSLQKVLKMAVITVSTVIIVFLAILSGYSFVQYQNTIKSKVNSYLYESADTLADSLARINSQMYDIYSYDANYEYLQYSSGIDSMESIYALNERLLTLQKMQQNTVGYIIFYDNFQQKKYYFNQEIFDNEDVETIKDIAQSIASENLSNRSWYYTNINESDYGICVYRSGNIALCQFYRLTDRLNAMLEEIDIQGTKAFFLNDEKIIGDNEIPERGYNIYKRPVAGSPLELVVAVPINFWTLTNINLIVLVIMTISVIIAALVLYRQLRLQLLFPLSQLISDMNNISQGNIDAKILSKSKFVEIQTVIDTTDTMIGEIEKQKLVAYERQLDSQRAKMQYLALQLKPHFFLNGLKTLNVMAMNGDTGKIQDVIMHFSTHLRYLLTLEREMVPLDSEIDYVNNYVALQREMTDRPIKLEWQVNVPRKDWLVPCLCIQTFIENSFKYAKLGSSTAQLIIYISINELDGEDKPLLDLYIRDNGEGYPEEFLDPLNSEPAEGSRHVGINNLLRRCRLVYGTDFEWIFANDNGAVSNLFLPFINEESKER